ncbi:MAG: c-type cytochrome [Deltaproteobacteria bacterium]|nr:c-type cytochrome [Deltaproteobacteria bacterium]
MRTRFLGVWQIAAVTTCLTTAACEGPTDPMERGAARYDQCAPCHGTKGEGKPELAAPPIGGLPRWYVLAQLDKFRIGARGAHLQDSPGLRMRTMALTMPTARDVEVVAHYVSSLPRATSAVPTVAGADAARGKAAFAACTACHGPDGAGNPQLNAPPIAGQADWYLLTQLNNFKHGVRGANPKDTTGSTMKAVAVALDDQQVKDLAVFVAAMPRG